MFSSKENEEWLKKAGVLSDALPYMKKFSAKTIIIKFGGHAMGENKLSSSFARDVVLLKQVGINPVIVHGGGPQIGKMLERLKIITNFVDGLRITDSSTVEVVEMVLSGSINKKIVSDINAAGGCAIGLSGKDGNMILADRLTRLKKDPDSNIEKVLDLGFVGEPKKINPEILYLLNESKIIPVIAPIGVGAKGETLTAVRDALKKRLPMHRNVALYVTKTVLPEMEAICIAENIAQQLEKRTPFRRTIRQAILRARKAGADGIKIQISGRLNGAEIARSEWLKEGRMPLQTLRAEILYSSKIAKTIHGILGIKVWIFKGEQFK